MKVNRNLASVLFAATLLTACESGGGTPGAAADAAIDSVDPSDSAGDTMASDTSGPQGSDAVSVDGAAVDGVAQADVETEPSEDDALATADGDEQGSEDGSSPDMIAGEGACTNDSDLEVLGEFDAAAELMPMGLACYDMAGGPGQTSGDDVRECFIAKLTADFGFTLDCSSCVADQLLCLSEFCMDACMSSMMTGQASPACDQCIQDSGCESAFSECSGLNPDAFTQ